MDHNGPVDESIARRHVFDELSALEGLVARCLTATDRDRALVMVARVRQLFRRFVAPPLSARSPHDRR